MKEDHGLSARQKLFADFYIEALGHNIAAGVSYVRAGYSNNGAAEGASRLLKNDKVAAYIEAEQQRLSEKMRIKKWQLLEFLSEAITTPIGDVNKDSTLCQEHTVDEVGEETVRTKIKMVDKLGAADRLCRMLGWFQPEVVKHEATEELEELIRLTRAGT
jgi:phage terminase small subunit